MGFQLDDIDDNSHAPYNSSSYDLPTFMILMLKDKVVMEINLDFAIYDVKDVSLLPFQLKGKLRKMPEIGDTSTRYEITQMLAAQRCNYNALLSFLSSRVLPITRENAKKVYSLFHLEQIQDDYSKAKIAVVCRALSLQDNYWIKLKGDTVTWDDVNLRTNHLSEAVAQVSLHGSSLTLTSKQGEALHTPELTGQGAYAKAWMREESGLYLYKKGANGNTEARVEVMVSNLLDNCNVEHLKYIEGLSGDDYVCKCLCMTDDTVSILSGMDFDSYCNVNGLDSRAEALNIDPEIIYKMFIVDYLISNRDRHGMNWGFFYDCNTMEILGCHPLYDHNNSFDIELMQDDEVRYLYDETMTMKQAAMLAMRKVDFHFYREFTKADFITERQYKSFMRRANDLGILVIPKTAMLDKIPRFDLER